MIGEQQTTAQFSVRDHVSVPLEIPLQIQRVYTNAVCSVATLKYQIQGDGINCIFEPASEKAPAMRIQQNPAVTQTGIEDFGIAATA